MKEIFEIAFAILASLGVSGGIIFVCSSWLGKIWANRILESDRAKFQKEIESLKSDLLVNIKEREIKVGAIQEERNKIVIKLAASLSKACSHCYVYAELGEVALRECFDLDFYIDIQKQSNESLNELWNECREAELFLSDDFYSELTKFQHELWSLRKQTSDTLYKGTQNTETGEVLVKRDISEILLELGEPTHQKKSVIMSKFRDILGTNPNQTNHPTNRSEQ
jgi:hypothetical protein